MNYRNRGSGIWRDVCWGMAEHELECLGSYRMIDMFGNEMPVRVIGDLPDGGKRVQVDLVRPLLPGEEGRFTVAYRQERGPLREGDVWTYRHRGDYPDNRLVTRSVLLPLGAEILAVSPDPLHRIQFGDRWLVVWRRYFRRGEVIPWEIRFRP